MKLRSLLIAMFQLATILNGGAAETNGSASSLPKFEVCAYRLEGDTALLPKSDGVISNYIGQVDLARLHEGLDQLQLFYHRSGFPNLRVILPQQTLTDGAVRVEIVNTLPVGVTNVPGRPSPAFEVLGYLVEGNAVLTPEQLGLLSDYTGRVDLACLHEGLDRLQLMCRQSGFSNLSVTLPQQEFKNGIVRVEIVTSVPAGIAGAPVTAAPAPAAITNTVTRVENAPATVTNTPAHPAPTFEVRSYLIEGNTVLPPEKFGLLSNYTGRVEFARVREGLGKLQLLYRELGFSTISVTLPQQKLTNGIVRVKVVEGKLAKIKVEGNRHFSTNNILRALPGLDTNILLNTKWFQPELDRANANLDRQIYPVISPGLEPGTSDLTLKVKDRLPLHGRLEVNDKSTPGTPLLRLDSALQYNNLWQLNHQLGLEYNFSPQAMKGGDYSPNFLDQPMVSSYSGFYRIPLDGGRGLQETYERLPVDFGYDQVTHQFRLPPATGNPEVIVIASRSVSDQPVNFGPLTTIFTNTLANISSQFAQRVLTFNDDLGARLTIPVRQFLGINSSLTLGLDYKSYEARTYSTNLAYFSLYAPDQFGNPVLVTNQTLRLPSNNRTLLQYVPLSWGWSAFRPDQQGVTSFSLNQNIFLAGVASARTNFQVVAGSLTAGGNYTTLNAGLNRRQNLPDDWSLLLRANGQWASAPLISNEQFALGGSSGVRGYKEGLHYGDTGWRVLFDVNAPPINIGYFPTANGDVPANLRCSWFMDYGQAYRIDRSASYAEQVGGLSRHQWGTGAGFFLTAGEHFDARLTLGWALLGNPENSAGSAQAYFSVGFQF
jgi:hemolysin activation/secretion protein